MGGEIARVLTAEGRAVLLAEDGRVLRFNGATPTAFVVMPTRRG
ncbi:hypothetical protein ACFTSF_27530 [Kribbella sp. NPDC056951]